MKIENTFSFQLDVADQLLLVLMKLELNLLFNDLARRFGISKSLASRMYNSWMPVRAIEKHSDHLSNFLLQSIIGSPFDFSTAKNYQCR